MLKFKDLFTVLNIFFGFFSIISAINGNITLAILFSTLFCFVADAMDGVVARITKTVNKFGSEFDNVADLISYSVAPSIIIYIAINKFEFFDKNITKILAILIGFTPLVTGCIRFARFNIKRIEFPGLYIGLPRPGSSLAIISFLGSHFFNINNTSKFFWMIYILLLSYLNITYLPFISHHNRKFPTYIKIILYTTLITCILSLFYSIFLSIIYKTFNFYYFFDCVAIWLFLFVFGSWLGIEKEEWKKYKEFIPEWKKF